ncbi:5'-nucleotidase [Prosthecochloris sp. GSB1]|uniref:5' nucleotidase, NT5C type n=1 Tax=Prosthecochloris sp. GSB1 TaxID=281093 RepID=UPI000B8CD17B|nr:5'-nucleotidase [Prosthecochloris sp. GSB1]ASQ91649.1 5'-nucleotidase [Prosthecochloris sp. GSB1]
MKKPEKDRPVIGVDLDGVCADFYGRMREIAAEWFEQPLESLTERVSHGLREWGIADSKQYESLHRFALNQRQLFMTMPMIPGARKYLRKLSDEGFHIRIITHRLFIHYSHAAAVQQTVAWLDGHGIPYWDLCFMKEKSEVGASIYVEDSPENVMRLREKGFYTICFANSTNREIASPRAASWREVYEMVHRSQAVPDDSSC